MKKTRRKLVLRTETVRALAAADLAHAVAGLGSANGQCLAAGTTDTHDAACPTTAAAVATATC